MAIVGEGVKVTVRKLHMRKQVCACATQFKEKGEGEIGLLSLGKLASVKDYKQVSICGAPESPTCLNRDNCSSGD